MQKLRHDFRNGIRPKECSTCWDEEAAGVLSHRQTFVEYRGLNEPINYDDLTPDGPQALDLKLSNACNLKCRICGPVASSLWLQEELKVHDPIPGSFFAQLADQRTYYLSNKITHDSTNTETIRSWLPELRYIEITGGEPMVSPENRELIELIATEGSPEQVGILFNTNATVIDDRIVKHLRHFREIKVCLSIDDIERRFEYERSPARWEIINENIDKYHRIADESWHLYAFCSVSLLNVWYLPEYLTWLHQKDEDARLGFVLNLVHYPRHFSVQVLPQKTKAAIKRRLTESVLDNPSYSHDVKEAVRGLLEFIGHERRNDHHHLMSGMTEIVTRDRIRGESYAQVFPEFFAELGESVEWPS